MATKKKTTARKASTGRAKAGARGGKSAAPRGKAAGARGKAASGRGAAKRGSGPARFQKAPQARGRTPGPKPAEKRAQRKVAAGPERVAAPAVPAAPDGARPIAVAIANAALDKKAEDVTVLDVRGLASYADYFVLMTADSDRQASAIADHVEQTMKAGGHTKVGAEGYETGRWILVDYGDVLAHVMSRETRQFYDLEGLWADAPRLRFEG
jgi:ribosome-associated protein